MGGTARPVVRVVCPLTLSFHESGFTETSVAERAVSNVLKRSYQGLPSDTAVAAAVSTTVAGGASGSTVSTTSSCCKNFLVIDALEYTEISCRGSLKRLCARVTIRVPWTPVIFLAVRDGAIGRVRRDINLALMLHAKIRNDCVGVIATRHMPLRGLVRAHERVLWHERRDMSLYELTFASYRDRGIAKRYLEANATNGSSDYLLFATSADSVVFDVALASFLRTPAAAHRSAGCAGIDVSKVFEMFVWCSVDVRAGNALVKLSAEELKIVGLPPNPLTALPVVSYDIETIANNMNAVPRGREVHHRLSSVALTVHASHLGLERSAIILAYAPVVGSDGAATLAQREAELQEALTACGTVCSLTLYDQEVALLYDAVMMLRDNSFLVDLYGLDNPKDARRLACTLIGYNSYDYDYRFLWCRLHFYGLHEHALAVQSFHREPRFCSSQISFDLMKHVQSRYRAQVGSVALSNVTRYFGARDRSERALTDSAKQLKMQFDAVSIRRLYYRFDSADSSDYAAAQEIFDEASAFALDPDRGLNLLRALRYNEQDCAAVYYLAQNLAFFEMIALYARHFMVGIVDASHVGNSRLLPNAFAKRALCESRTVLHYRCNTVSMFTVQRAMLDDRCGVKKYRSRELLELVALPDHLALRHEDDGDGDGDGDGRHLIVVVLEEARRLSRQAVMSNEKNLMRINDKVYVGGVNSASSGHYRCPVAVDFASFYPSIGCQFGLSMETVRVLTVQQFILAFGEFSQIDQLITCGLLRVFDYEPPGSTAVRLDKAWPLKGRDDMAAGVIEMYGGWYEGMEFCNAHDVVRSSADLRKRRVLIVYRPSPDYTPVISGLWTHYLSMRKRYKTLLRELKSRSDLSSAQQASQRNVYECMEKMFKVVANSLYGYLNYERSVVYSPAVAAAVTLLSRKTFHETTWICEHLFPRTLPTLVESVTSTAIRCSPVQVDVVYRDTDGLILHTTPMSEDVVADASEFQRVYEVEIVNLINRTMSRCGNTSIVIELDDSGLQLCCIMGKKKYWKSMKAVTNTTTAPPSQQFVTKGFEKNAQAFVKHIVRVLQSNTLEFVRRLGDAVDGEARSPPPSFRLVLQDVRAFFCSIYDALHTYYLRHGAQTFAFAMALNPRSNDSSEARFIQDTLTRYNFAIGDRAKCLFVLDPADLFAVRFQLIGDFRPDRDRVNYFRVIRRLAIYLLQTVEGFKRACVDTLGDETVRDTFDYSSVRMSSAAFDQCLIDAYVAWLTNASESSARYAGMLADPDDESVTPERRVELWTELRESGAIQCVPMRLRGGWLNG